jgi:hypothetical protein
MFYWVTLASSIILLPILWLEFCRRNGLRRYFSTLGYSIHTIWILLIPIYNITVFTTVLGYQNLIVSNIGNFLLHVIGGGFTCSIVFEYLNVNLRILLSWKWQLILLILVTSAFSVANEVFEMGLEYFANQKIILDNWDTWRDILANIVGAGIGFLLIKYFKVVYYYFWRR